MSGFGGGNFEHTWGGGGCAPVWHKNCLITKNTKSKKARKKQNFFWRADVQSILDT